MKVETILTLAAQCDRAARDGANEDNCLVVSPVGCENPIVNHFGDVAGFSEVVPLRDKGCLLVVADGMGGMNAGEVASHIAVTTLAKCFSEAGLKSVELTDNSIRKFIRKSILTADDAIKKTASKDKEKEGMGTTVVLMWILPDNTAYYAWCGDSRLYRYTPDMGLQTLTRDHSYVMEMLHLSEEEAFVHPDNNIITRSLGNPSEKANPEIEGPFQIYKGDLLLLCSDGLCGVLPSQKIIENISCIEDILEEHIPDADHLIDGINELWTAAAAAGWHDNVTTLLCQVKEGPKRPAAEKKPKPLQTNKSNPAEPPLPRENPPVKESEKKLGRKDTLIALLVVALVFVGSAGWFFKTTRSENASFRKQPQQEGQHFFGNPKVEKSNTSTPDNCLEGKTNHESQTNKSTANSNAAIQYENRTNERHEQVARPNTSKQVSTESDTTKLNFSKPKTQNKQNQNAGTRQEMMDKANSNKNGDYRQTTAKNN